MKIIRFYFGNWFSAIYLLILSGLTAATFLTSNGPLHYTAGTWLHHVTMPSSPVVVMALNVIAGWSVEATMTTMVLTSGLGNATAISLIVRGVRQAGKPPSGPRGAGS